MNKVIRILIMKRAIVVRVNLLNVKVMGEKEEDCSAKQEEG